MAGLPTLLSHPLPAAALPCLPLGLPPKQCEGRHPPSCARLPIHLPPCTCLLRPVTRPRPAGPPKLTWLLGRWDLNTPHGCNCVPLHPGFVAGGQQEVRHSQLRGPLSWLARGGGGSECDQATAGGTGAASSPSSSCLLATASGPGTCPARGLTALIGGSGAADRASGLPPSPQACARSCRNRLGAEQPSSSWGHTSAPPSLTRWVLRLCLLGRAALGDWPSATAAAAAAAWLQEYGEGENELFQFGVAAMQGWRTDMVRVYLTRREPPSAAAAAAAQPCPADGRVGVPPLLDLAPLLAPPQEDAHAAVLDVDGASRTGFFAVFDGHGGKEVAKFCAAHLVGAGRLARTRPAAWPPLAVRAVVNLPPARRDPRSDSGDITELGTQHSWVYRVSANPVLPVPAPRPLPQPQELSTTDGFRNGELDRALVESYLKMDEMLLKDEHREELKALKGSESEEEPQG